MTASTDSSHGSSVVTLDSGMAEKVVPTQWTKQPESSNGFVDDSELIAKAISGSTQRTEYYRNYKPDYEIKTSLLGDPCMQWTTLINPGQT